MSGLRPFESSQGYVQALRLIRSYWPRRYDSDARIYIRRAIAQAKRCSR